MSKDRHYKYPYRRVEEKHNNAGVDPRSMREQRAMEKQARISIGTFSIFQPKPDSEINSFTLALSKPIPKYELYRILHETFDGHWDGEPIRSVFIHLSSPIPLEELRRKLKDSFVDVIPP